MIGKSRFQVLGPVLVVPCLAMASAQAGAIFEKEFPSAAAATDKVKLSLMNGNQDGAESGRGPTPYLKALGGPPKRVALISFYVWDRGNKKEDAYRMYGGNYTYHVRSTRTRNVEAGAVDMIAAELYDASIADFKEAFAAHGTQVLTPDEFLDTAEKKATYESFEMKMSGIVKFLGKSQKTSTADKWHFTGAPEGFRVFQLVTINDEKGNHFELGAAGVGVGKLAHSLGYDFANALGVDAVAILYNVIQGQKKSITLLGSYLYMFGPNPVPDSGQSLYWDGHQYSGVYLKMNVPFVVTDADGNMVDADYLGYAVVAKSLAERMGQHLEEKASGAK